METKCEAMLIKLSCTQALESGGSHSVVIDKSDVVERVSELLKKQDLSKYVL